MLAVPGGVPATRDLILITRSLRLSTEPGSAAAGFGIPAVVDVDTVPDGGAGGAGMIGVTGVDNVADFRFGSAPAVGGVGMGDFPAPAVAASGLAAPALTPGRGLRNTCILGGVAAVAGTATGVGAGGAAVTGTGVGGGAEGVEEPGVRTSGLHLSRNLQPQNWHLTLLPQVSKGISSALWQSGQDAGAGAYAGMVMRLGNGPSFEGTRTSGS